MHPVQIVRICNEMRSDGLQCEVADRVARLGGDGMQPSHIERDLHRWLSGLFGVTLEPSYLTLTLDNPQAEGLQTVEFPVLAMHEALHAISNAGWPQFNMTLIGDEGTDGISHFWEWALSQKWGQMHPVAGDGGDLSRTLGILWHMDGGSMFKNTEYDAWSGGGRGGGEEARHTLHVTAGPVTVETGGRGNAMPRKPRPMHPPSRGSAEELTRLAVAPWPRNLWCLGWTQEPPGAMRFGALYRRPPEPP